MLFIAFIVSANDTNTKIQIAEYEKKKVIKNIKPLLVSPLILLFNGYLILVKTLFNMLFLFPLYIILLSLYHQE